MAAARSAARLRCRCPAAAASTRPAAATPPRLRDRCRRGPNGSPARRPALPAAAGRTLACREPARPRHSPGSRFQRRAGRDVADGWRCRAHDGPRTSSRRLASINSRRRVCSSAARSVSQPTNAETSRFVSGAASGPFTVDGEFRPGADQGIRRRLPRQRHVRINRRAVEIENAVKRKLAPLCACRVVLARRICPAAIVTSASLCGTASRPFPWRRSPRPGFSASRSRRSGRPHGWPRRKPPDRSPRNAHSKV